jgi:hypothetical protein
MRAPPVAAAVQTTPAVRQATISQFRIMAAFLGAPGRNVNPAGCRPLLFRGLRSDVRAWVPAGAVWSGYPARPHREALRVQALLFRLPELIRSVRRLERKREEDEREA